MSDHAYYHFAIIASKLASCVTFLSPSQVPPGLAYNVSRTKKLIFCNLLYDCIMLASSLACI